MATVSVTVRRERADLDESELEVFLDRSQLGLHTLGPALGPAPQAPGPASPAGGRGERGGKGGRAERDESRASSKGGRLRGRHTGPYVRPRGGETAGWLVRVAVEVLPGGYGAGRGLDIARWLISRKHRGCSVFGKGF